MFKEQSYIYKKEVDWSVLREGFSIPVSIQMIFKERIKNYLKRGEKRDIKVILDNNTYQVKFINQAFDEQKYPGHADILQIRYSPQNPFVIRLREIFDHITLSESAQIKESIWLRRKTYIKQTLAIYCLKSVFIFFIIKKKKGIT